MSLLIIDSLRVRINMRHVKIVNSGLFDEFAKLNLTTGEIEKENNEKPIRIIVKKKGFNYEMAIRKFQIGGLTDHYLVIILNSKFLKVDCFDGLTPKNIKEIYDSIIELGFVTFSWEDFLTKSNGTDIDICLDFKANTISYNQHLDSLMKITPFTKERDRGYKKYKNGIEWSNRATATNCHPFLKIYDKEKELWSKSNVFTEYYLTDASFADKKRIEFTVKDASHLKHFNVADSSLWSILHISQLKRREMLKTVMGKVLNMTSAVRPSDSNDEKPDRAVLIHAMRYMFSNGVNKEATINHLITNLNTSNKSKYRKKIGELWDSNVETCHGHGGEAFLRFLNLD